MVSLRYREATKLYDVTRLHWWRKDGIYPIPPYGGRKYLPAYSRVRVADKALRYLRWLIDHPEEL
jgi:hypothetical protein